MWNLSVKVFVVPLEAIFWSQLINEMVWASDKNGGREISKKTMGGKSEK